MTVTPTPDPLEADRLRVLGRPSCRGFPSPTFRDPQFPFPLIWMKCKSPLMSLVYMDTGRLPGSLMRNDVLLVSLTDDCTSTRSLVLCYMTRRSNPPGVAIRGDKTKDGYKWCGRREARGGARPFECVTPRTFTSN
jgi:hypothetical protein